MAISFGSINTGLPKNIVEKLVEAERAPIKKLEASKEKYQSKQKLVKELSSIISNLKNMLSEHTTGKGLQEFKVITNNDIVDVTVDKLIAEPGSYQFEVDRLAQKSSAFSSPFEDPQNSYVGVGFIQYELPNGEVKEVYVDSSNASLEGVAKLINQDKTNGMKANVVNDGYGNEKSWRLLITLEDTGDEQFADFPYFYFVDGIDDFFLDQERSAKDALVKLEGFEVEVAKNKVNNLVPGLSIDLKKAAPGEEFTIQVVLDSAAVKGKIEDIVDRINSVLKFIIDQNDLDEKSDTFRTLGGDITLQNLESRLRNIIFREHMTRFGSARIGDLGIEFQKDGLLTTNKNKLESTLAKNYGMAADLLTGSYINNSKQKSSGVFGELLQFLNHALRRPDGLLTIRENGLQNNIRQIEQRIEDRERIVEKKQAMLKDKFARLEGTISRIRAQGSGLQSINNSFNPVTELG